MINNPSDNVKLSNEQNGQLAVFEGKLFSIKSETAIATKTLSSLKDEVARMMKEKDYQSELLEKVNAQLADSQTKVTGLNELFVSKSNELVSLDREITSKSLAHSSKESELKDREDAVSKKEQDVFSAHEALIERQARHDESVARFNAKVAKLKEVTSSF